MTADAALVYLLKELEGMETNNSFAKSLRISIVRRLRERRNEEIVWLAKYLINPQSILKEDKISGKIPVRTKFLNFANRLAKRMMDTQNEEEKCGDTEENIDESETETLSKKDLLHRAMANAMLEQPGRAVPKSLAQDLKMFEITREKTEILETIHQAILSAKPTSVESERSFSVGGGFATKVRSRLSDQALSSLVFLKLYFKALK